VRFSGLKRVRRDVVGQLDLLLDFLSKLKKYLKNRLGLHYVITSNGTLVLKQLNSLSQNQRPLFHKNSSEGNSNQFSSCWWNAEGKWRFCLICILFNSRPISYNLSNYFASIKILPPKEKSSNFIF